MAIAQTYKQLPSDIIGLHDDEYAAYCFNEACVTIQANIRSGKKLNPLTNPLKKRYRRASEMYADILNKAPSIKKGG